MEINRDNNRIELDFSSDSSLTLSVIEELITFLVSRKCDLDTFAFKLLMQELLVNAVLHGNKANKEKKVHVTLELKGPLLEVKVVDEGELKLEPLAPVDLDETVEGSRGFLLVDLYGYTLKSLTKEAGYLLSREVEYEK